MQKALGLSAISMSLNTFEQMQMHLTLATQPWETEAKLTKTPQPGNYKSSTQLDKEEEENTKQKKRKQSRSTNTSNRHPINIQKLDKEQTKAKSNLRGVASVTAATTGRRADGEKSEATVTANCSCFSSFLSLQRQRRCSTRRRRSATCRRGQRRRAAATDGDLSRRRTGISLSSLLSLFNFLLLLVFLHWWVGSTLTFVLLMGGFHPVSLFDFFFFLISNLRVFMSKIGKKWRKQ